MMDIDWCGAMSTFGESYGYDEKVLAWDVSIKLFEYPWLMH